MHRNIRTRPFLNGCRALLRPYCIPIAVAPAVHHFLTSGRTRRPVCINLLDGHLEFVVKFLDELTYGPGSTPGTQDTYKQWKKKIR